MVDASLQAVGTCQSAIKLPSNIGASVLLHDAMNTSLVAGKLTRMDEGSDGNDCWVPNREVLSLETLYIKTNAKRAPVNARIGNPTIEDVQNRPIFENRFTALVDVTESYDNSLVSGPSLFEPYRGWV